MSRIFRILAWTLAFMAIMMSMPVSAQEVSSNTGAQAEVQAVCPTITQTIEKVVGPANMNWTRTAVFDNPQGYKIVGVELTVLAEVNATIKAEYSGEDPIQGQAVLETEIQTTVGSTSLPAVKPKAFGQTHDFAGYDGTLDYSGPSGFDFGSLATNAQSTQNMSPAEFVGVNTTVTVVAVGKSRVDGGGNFASLITNTGKVTLSAKYTLQPACVGNLVWHDQDNDGSKDPDEPGIDGIKIELWAPPQGLLPAHKVEETTTANGGQFMFDELKAGQYWYEFAGYPPGYTAVTKIDTVDNGEDNDSNCRSITLAGTTVNSILFTLEPGSEPGPTVDGDDTNTDSTMDCGLWNPTPSISINKLTNGTDGSTISIGQPVIWTYEVRNTGNTALSQVIVSDDKEGQITCPLVDLQPGGVMTCQKSGIAVLGNYTNTATVKGTSTALPTPVTVTDADSSGYIGAALDLALLKNCPDDAVPGQRITCEITVVNQGNIAAGLVTIEDRLPPQLTLSASDTYGWKVVGGKVVNTVNGIPVGANEHATLSIVLDVSTELTGTTNITNTAEIIEARDQQGIVRPDVDSTPGNNNPLEDDQMSVTIPVRLLYIIGNRVFIDANDNGVLDQGEVGYPGASVTLINSTGLPLMRTTTDANGYYYFPELNAGQYVVRLSMPPGYDLANGRKPVDQTDSDNNGFITSTVAVSSTLINVGPGYSAPIGEVDPPSQPAGVIDSLADFTVDFAIKARSGFSQIFLPIINNGQDDVDPEPTPEQKFCEAITLEYELFGTWYKDGDTTPPIPPGYFRYRAVGVPPKDYFMAGHSSFGQLEETRVNTMGGVANTVTVIHFSNVGQRTLVVETTPDGKQTWTATTPEKLKPAGLARFWFNFRWKDPNSPVGYTEAFCKVGERHIDPLQ